MMVLINTFSDYSYWYSNQEACVRWHSCTSAFFTIGNGTRQGGVLSPLMYTRYMKNILVKLAGAQIGCNIGGMVMNVLAHADYTVLLAPAWRAMQRLLDVLPTEVCIINMECNVGKTMCMVFFS
jgi:Reverse transcriptase (RNA-dependent DNA polymerase)